MSAIKSEGSKVGQIVEAIIAGAIPLGDISIKREGLEIICPPNITNRELIQYIKQKDEMEEKVVNIVFDLDGYPTDGLIALFRAMRHVFGFTGLSGNKTMTGEAPPVMLDIPTGYDENGKQTFEQATLGKIEPPMFQGGFLQAQINGDGPKLTVVAQVKSKFTDKVNLVKEEAMRFLKEQSIYKGRPIQVNLEYIDNDDFDPINSAPKFMDVKGLTFDSLILDPVTAFDLKSSVVTLIENSNECVASGVDLKHGVLLLGPYGTGKSFTAKVLAAIAQKNNWTFIYLEKSAEHLAEAIKLASLYAPAVLFAEDVDAVTSGERDEDLNERFNVLDGIDTKGLPLITILTTNNPEKIHPGFLRPGRIDSIIHMAAPNAEVASRFVSRLCGKLLAPNADVRAIGEAMTGFTPAFIAEAIKKAKRYAINREQSGNLTGKISQEDLVLAAQSLRTHEARVNAMPEPTPEQKLAAAWTLIGEHMVSKVLKSEDHKYQQLQQRVEQLYNKLV